MHHDRLTPRALMLALVLAALWGGNPVAIKVGLADCPPLRLGWMRFVLGGVVVLAFARWRGESLRMERHERKALFWIGALFASQLAFLNIGQDATTAGHAVVIMSSYPLWTALFAHFLVPGDVLTRKRVLGAGVAYLGVVVVFSAGLGGEGAYSLSGDALLVGSSVLLGARQIALALSAQGISVTKLLLAQAVVGTLTFLAASTALEPEPTRYTASFALALLYQGVIIAGFAFLLHVRLLRDYPPSRVSTVFLTQPIFGVLWSFWVLGERIGSELYLGAALVIGGTYLVQRHD